MQGQTIKKKTSDLSFWSNTMGMRRLPWKQVDQHRHDKVSLYLRIWIRHAISVMGLNQISLWWNRCRKPHQNTGHRSIPMHRLPTLIKALIRRPLMVLTFIQGGLNNGSMPEYNSVAAQLNSEHHESLSCIECHNDLTLPTPQGIYKPDNYTIKNTINNFTPSLASIQEFKDYFILNVNQEGPLNITLDWRKFKYRILSLPPQF